MLYFQKISFSEYLEITTAVVVQCAALKSLAVRRYSVIFTFSGPLGLKDSTLLFGNRVALKPGLGGVRDVGVRDAVFPKDLFFQNI